MSQEKRKRSKAGINDVSVVIPLPVAQLTSTTSSSQSSNSGASSAASSSSTSSSGSFCGSPAGEAGSSSSDAGFYEMTAEEIDTSSADAEDFMHFQVGTVGGSANSTLMGYKETCLPSLDIETCLLPFSSLIDLCVK